MTKYIIEYVAGTKGDMLARFLNNSPSHMLDDDNKRTLPAVIGMPNWLKVQYKEGQTLDRYRRVLETNKNKYITAHVQYHFGKSKEFDNLLKEFDYKIIKIVFGKKYYTTILLESLVKNFGSFDKSEDDYPVKIENFVFLNHKEHINKLFNIKHFNDFEYSNSNLLLLFSYLLSNLKSASVLNRYEYFNNNDLDNKIILDYEKLYIAKDLSEYRLFDGYDIEEYSKFCLLYTSPSPRDS